MYGISTFYDDLAQPRGRRHVSVCTGTACWAADFGAHVADAQERLGLGLGERTDDGELSLGPTVCLGYCHSAGAVRDGEVVDAGPGALERVAAGEARPAEEPAGESMLDEPVLLAPGDWEGLRHALASLSAEEYLEQVKEANVRGRGGAGFPAGTKWQFARGAPAEERVIVVNGDEGDPGSYIDKLLMERSPDLLLEGMALAGYAVGASVGLVLVRSEYPRSTPVLRAAVERARAEGHLGEDIHGSGFSFDVFVTEGAGSYVVGEETALLASLQGLRGAVQARPPFPAERGWHGKPTVVNNVETLCNAPFIARHGAEAYKALSPGATPGTKLVSLNDRFERPGLYEVRFGTPLSEICDGLGGGLRDGHEIKAIQIGGPLGGILPGWKLDTPFDFDELAAEGCMVGHGSILAFDERTDMRALARHLLEFGAHESCGKCFPCRIGLQRAFEMVDAPGALDRPRLEALLETLELGSLCAHGGGMPAPIRSLIEHWPEELGLSGPRGPRAACWTSSAAVPRSAARTIPAGGRWASRTTREGHGRRPRARGRAGHDGARGGAGGGARRAHALLRRPHDPVRGLPRVHGRRGGGGGADRLVHHALPRRHGDPHRRRDLAADRRGHGRAGAVRAAPGAGRAHRAGPRGALARGGRAALARPGARGPPRPAPPLPGAPARALHLLRALRARLRRDPGGVRAHRHRAWLRLRDHRGTRLRLHRIHLRLLRGLRRHLPHRRHHRTHAAGRGRGVH